MVGVRIGHVKKLFGSTVLQESYNGLAALCLFKNQRGKYHSAEFCSDRPKCQSSQRNCTLLFHFKGFVIVNTGRTPNPAKIQEHQLCCLLAYRNTSLPLATDILSRKENVLFSCKHCIIRERPQLEICFLLTHSTSFSKLVF